MSRTTRTKIPEWNLADRLRKSLEHCGVEVDEMAAYLEVHPNTIRNWIAGRTNPHASHVKLWAMKVDLPYEWLAHGIDDGEPVRHQGLEPRTRWLEHRPGDLTGNEILAMRKTLRAEIRSQIESKIPQSENGSVTILPIAAARLAPRPARGDTP